MQNIIRVIMIMALSAALFACSSGVDETAVHDTGQDVPEVNYAPDIDGFMGFLWGDGTDVLLDQSFYEEVTEGDTQTFSHYGEPYLLGEYGIEVYYESYTFVDGRYAGGEVWGENPDDMEEMRSYYSDEFGNPQEVSGMYFKWVSRTGYIELEDMGGHWRMAGREE